MDGLSKRKEIYVNDDRKKKLESLNESILSLNQKKDLLERAIADLKMDSDEFAWGRTWISVKQLISKSNSLKRAAVKKQEEIDECLKEKKRPVEKRKDLWLFVSNRYNLQKWFLLEKINLLRKVGKLLQ